MIWLRNWHLSVRVQHHVRYFAQSTETNIISLSSVKKLLKDRNITFADGYTNLVIKDCSWCKIQKKKIEGSVFINKITGHFLCEFCKITGPWNKLQNVITNSADENLVNKLKNDCSLYDGGAGLWKKIVNENQSILSLDENDVSIIFEQFGLKPVLKKVYDKIKIYVSEDRNILYLSLNVSATNKTVGYITLCKSSEDSKSTIQTSVPKNNCPGYLLHSCSKTKDAVLVSTIPDWFALVSLNLPYNVICLPHGTSNLPQSLLCFFEQFEKLILWFDSNIGVSDAARNFAKKLNDKRCYIIIPVENRTSPRLAVANGESIKKILSTSQPTWHRSITTFTSLREDVLSELQNYERVQGVKWKRYLQLNKILKGHRRGELTVLTGPTGSGKTTFMSEYSLDLASQGVNTLWGSFEIRNVRLARTMLQQYAERALDENVGEFDHWADLFEQLPVYFMTFHGQQSLNNVMDAVEHASYIHDISHVIIDNVQFMMGITDESKHIDRFWRQDNIIHSFRSFATKNNCHVTLVIHPRKERDEVDLTTSSIFGGAKAAQEADNILIIQDKRLTSIKGKKYLQVAKNRYTGDLGVMPLEFNKTSLSYAVKKKKTTVDENPEPTDKIVVE